MEAQNDILSLVKFMREKNKLTQEDLAKKAGVGLRFIRDLEQGKQTLRLDKVNQVLSLFGYRVGAELLRKQDQWEVIMSFLNQHVQITLKNKPGLDGYIIDYKMEDQKVKYWSFVSIENALKYRETKNESLKQLINGDELVNVEKI